MNKFLIICFFFLTRKFRIGNNKAYFIYKMISTEIENIFKVLFYYLFNFHFFFFSIRQCK